TCQRLGVEPSAYLQDVLTCLPPTPARQLGDLLPDQWQSVRQAKTAIRRRPRPRSPALLRSGLPDLDPTTLRFRPSLPLAATPWTVRLFDGSAYLLRVQQAHGEPFEHLSEEEARRPPGRVPRVRRRGVGRQQHLPREDVVIVPTCQLRRKQQRG